MNERNPHRNTELAAKDGGESCKPEGVRAGCAQQVQSSNEQYSAPPVSVEGVDLTQILALLALSPTERVRFLVETVDNLDKLRAHARRI